MEKDIEDRLLRAYREATGNPADSLDDILLKPIDMNHAQAFFERIGASIFDPDHPTASICVRCSDAYCFTETGHYKIVEPAQCDCVTHHPKEDTHRD